MIRFDLMAFRGSHRYLVLLTGIVIHFGYEVQSKVLIRPFTFIIDVQIQTLVSATQIFHLAETNRLFEFGWFFSLVP